MATRLELTWDKATGRWCKVSMFVSSFPLHGAMIVVWNGGPMHKGVPIAEVLADYPRLSLERLPPYAPDLNPVEYLWSHLKYGKLADFNPDDVFQLNEVLREHLARASRSRERLDGFLRASGLPFW
jgi:hypothetical protein